MSADRRRQKLAAVNAFERAVDALAFKGASHPEDHTDIERRYASTKKKLFTELGLDVR